jgi:1,4-dihydroxy-2-naphthoyl-CoA hydrolase
MTPSEVAKLMNENPLGYTKVMGLDFVSVAADLVEARFTVADVHLQPYGIVHGGVHAGVVETLCSIGAAVSARERGHQGGVVGLENHTSFVRAAKTGQTLHARATPITRGRTTHVWECEVRDEQDRIVAKGSLRLLCVGLDQLG